METRKWLQEERIIRCVRNWTDGVRYKWKECQIDSSLVTISDFAKGVLLDPEAKLNCTNE